MVIVSNRLIWNPEVGFDYLWIFSEWKHKALKGNICLEKKDSCISRLSEYYGNCSDDSFLHVNFELFLVGIIELYGMISGVVCNTKSCIVLDFIHENDKTLWFISCFDFYFTYLSILGDHCNISTCIFLSNFCVTYHLFFPFIGAKHFQHTLELMIWCMLLDFYLLKQVSSAGAPCSIYSQR